jgi:FAD/FMN-containing dehydrogenase
MDPPAPAPAVGDHAMLAELPEEAIAAYLAEVGPGSTSSLLFAELRQLGGALGRPVDGGGVSSHVDGAFALFCVAMAPFPEAAERGRADARAMCEAMAPWSTGGRLLNFTDHHTDVSTGYGERWERLRAICAAVDPDGVFVANHSVR